MKKTVELRYNDNGTLDEAIIYINGVCVYHLEQMDDGYWWMGLESDKGQVHINLATKKKAHIVADVIDERTK